MFETIRGVSSKCNSMYFYADTPPMRMVTTQTSSQTNLEPNRRTRLMLPFNHRHLPEKRLPISRLVRNRTEQPGALTTEMLLLPQVLLLTTVSHTQNHSASRKPAHIAMISRPLTSNNLRMAEMDEASRPSSSSRPRQDAATNLHTDKSLCAK